MSIDWDPYDDEFKAASLEAVFEHYGARWPSGSGERPGLCPVHDDTRPSCTINTTTGVYYCFTCGASGNAVNLIMVKEGLDYATALTVLSDVLGSGDSRLPGAGESERNPLGLPVIKRDQRRRKRAVQPWSLL